MAESGNVVDAQERFERKRQDNEARIKRLWTRKAHPLDPVYAAQEALGATILLLDADDGYNKNRPRRMHDVYSHEAAMSYLEEVLEDLGEYIERGEDEMGGAE